MSLPQTPVRPPVIVDNDLAQRLLERPQYADMLAPADPFIVDYRCNGNVQERIVFRALHLCCLLYEDRDWFTYEDIHRFAQGVSKTGMGTPLRGLCDKELVDVIGHREDARLKGTNRAGGKRREGYNREEHRSARFRIDFDRLIRESANAWAELIRELALPMPMGGQRCAIVPPSQSRMDMDAGGAPLPLRNGQPLPQENGERASPTPPIPLITPEGAERNGDHTRRAMGKLSDAELQPPAMRAEYGDHSSDHMVVPPSAANPHEPFLQGNRSTQTMPLRDPAPFLQGNRDTPLQAESPQPFLQGNGDDTPIAMVEQAAIAPEVWQRYSHGYMGRGVGSMEGGEEEGEGEAHAHVDLESVIDCRIGQAFETHLPQALAKALAALNLPQLISPTQPLPAPLLEAVPCAPVGEPEIDDGPTAAWAQLVGRPLEPGEPGQLREIVRAFETQSNGFAAYWLVRAMFTVAIDGRALNLRYVRGVLRRLSQAGRWDSTELALASGDQRTESPPPASVGAQTRSGGARRERPPVRSTPAKTAPTSGTLPAELQASPAVGAYLTHAEPGTKLSEPWAKAIHERVRQVQVWDDLCANWKLQYDYTNIDGMLDRYGRDVQALSAHRAAAPRQGVPSRGIIVGANERIQRRAQDLMARYNPQTPNFVHRLDVGLWLIAQVQADVDDATILRALAERFPDQEEVQA